VGVGVREARTLAGRQSIDNEAESDAARDLAEIAREADALLVEWRRVVPLRFGDIRGEGDERVGRQRHAEAS